jgi:hypothetical protein
LKLGVEWAAGFFEGEGSACCYQKTGQRSKRFQLSVNQVNRKALDTFCEIVGVGKVRGPYGPYRGQLNKKPIYIWKVVGEEAIKVSSQLLPFLLEKGQQISNKLQTYEQYKEVKIGPINPS